MASQPHEASGVAPGVSRVQFRMDLKPWNLSSSATLTELRRWRQKFKQYYLSFNMAIMTIRRQQATLAGCLDCQFAPI